MMRAGYLDNLRGIAVIMMIIFHASYDMRMLGMVQWDFSQGFWWVWPRVIAFTFLFCVGLSLNYTHVPKINWQSLKKRTFQIGGGALIISLGSYYFAPNQWVYFGTLHCILAGSFFGALVVNKRPMAWSLMFLIIFFQYAAGYDIKWLSSLLQRPSLDFIPIYPWFWAVLLGIVIGPYLSKSRQLTEMRSPPFLRVLATHSLKIYLLHQPIIFGTLWIINALNS